MSKLDDMIKKLCPDGVEFVKLGEVCIIKRGVRVVKKELLETGSIPVYQNSLTPLGFNNSANYPGGTTFVISAGAAGEIGFSNIPFWAADDCLCISCPEHVLNKYVYHFLKKNEIKIKSKVRKASVPRLSRTVIDNIEIPLPQLEVQAEIVRILDKFTQLEAELDCRKRQYEFYRDQLLSFDKNTPPERNNVVWKKLSEGILSINTGLNPRRFFRLNTPDAHNYYVTIKEMQNGCIVFNENTDKINDEAMNLCNKRSKLEAGDLLFSGTGTIGQIVVLQNTPTNWNIKEGVYAIKPKQEIVLSKFLAYLLSETSVRNTYLKKAMGGTVKSVPMKILLAIEIPIPPLTEQNRIVAILDHFEALTTSLQNGLPAEIAARRQQCEYYRDKLLNFKKKIA